MVSNSALSSSSPLKIVALENKLGTTAAPQKSLAHEPQAASGNDSAASIQPASVADVAVGLSASNQPKNPRCDLTPGSNDIASSWMATIECSCCNRLPVSPAVKAGASSPARVLSPWNCKASVEYDTAFPREPMTVHGHCPPIDWFCREATATPVLE